jgi:hypothetical protein
MNAIETIIERFGGLTDMARALGHKNPTTVQGWRDRGNIPSRQIPVVIEAGKNRNPQIDLVASDFFDAATCSPVHTAEVV